MPNMQAAAVTSRPSRDLRINKTWVGVLVAVLRRLTDVALGHETSLPALLAATTHECGRASGRGPPSVGRVGLPAYGRPMTHCPAGRAEGRDCNATICRQDVRRQDVPAGSLRPGTFPTSTRNRFRSAG